MRTQQNKPDHKKRGGKGEGRKKRKKKKENKAKQTTGVVKNVMLVHRKGKETLQMPEGHHTR